MHRQLDLLPSSPRKNCGSSPALRARPDGELLKQSCPGGMGMGQIKMRSTCHFSSVLQEAAERRRLQRSFKGKRGKLLECGWRRITYQNLSLYLKLCFKISNQCAYDAYCNGLFFAKETNNFFSQV